MRYRRIKLKGETAVYHCMSRIVGGQHLLGPDEEREHFRKLMRPLARFCGIEIITHAVMSNHFHLLIRVPPPRELSDQEVLERARAIYSQRDTPLRLLEEEFERHGRLSEQIRQQFIKRMGDISEFMKQLKMGFSKGYNKRHDRYGTLWAERFKSLVVEDQPSSVRTVAAYIDLNSVRAGQHEDPMDFRFCGYGEAVAGNREAREGIRSFHPEGSWEEVAESYRQYLMVGAGRSGHSSKRVLDRETIRKILKEGGKLAPGQILRLSNRYMKDGVAFGSTSYVEGVYERYRDRFSPKRKRGARSLKRLQLGDVATLRDLRDPLN